MKKVRWFLLLACAFMPFAEAQNTPRFPIGINALVQLDRLPLLHRGLWFQSVTSISATGESAAVLVDGETAVNGFNPPGTPVLPDSKTNLKFHHGSRPARNVQGSALKSDREAVGVHFNTVSPVIAELGFRFRDTLLREIPPDANPIEIIQSY